MLRISLRLGRSSPSQIVPGSTALRPLRRVHRRSICSSSLHSRVRSQFASYGPLRSFSSMTETTSNDDPLQLILFPYTKPPTTAFGSNPLDGVYGTYYHVLLCDIFYLCPHARSFNLQPLRTPLHTHLLYTTLMAAHQDKPPSLTTLKACPQI
jgi:hypothetical protein